MKHKKILAILLCACMALSACGTNAASSAPAASSPEELSSTRAEASAAPEAPTEVPAEAPAASAEDAQSGSLFVDVALPLTDTTETLTMWWGGFDGGNFGNDTPGATMISQAAQEATNVEIEYSFCSGMDFIEQTALMFASDDWPDMIKGPSMYTGGLSAGVEEGVFLELTDDMAAYSPNYYSRITANEDLYKQVVTDEGYLVKYYSIYDQPARQNTGLIVRSDYLNQLDMDAPVTYDDWTNMLSAFQTELSLQNPFNLGSDALEEMLMAGYGVTDGWFQMDGTVYYAPVEEGYREYLSMLKDWYDQGFISQNFMNETVSDDRLNNIYEGNFGAYVDDYGSITSFKVLSDDPSFESQAVQAPVKSASDTTHFYSGGALVDNMENGGIALSTSCRNVELCMRWVDFFYSKEGSLIFSYGVEGESYVDNGDGTYSYTELITNNPDGWGITFARLIYLDGCAGTGLYWTDRDLIDLDQGSLDAETIWSTNSDDAYVLPQFDLNGDDASTFSNIMSDIETYVDEMTLKFITGAESLDDYDSFVSSVESMDLSTAAALQQDGLDRYNQR